MSINEQHKYHGVASLYLWEALSEHLPDAHFHLGIGSSNSLILLTGLYLRPWKGAFCPGRIVC